jgi:hypothetical protein
LHESVEEVGRDTSPYDAFSPALVDFFFVAIFFETRCVNIREYAFLHVNTRLFTHRVLAGALKKTDIKTT